MKLCSGFLRASVLPALTAAIVFLAASGGYGGGSSGGGGGGGGGTLAPPTPTGLTPTAGNMQVSLTWNASSGAVGYYVKRSTVSGSEIRVATVSMTSDVDTGLTNNVKYY